MDNISNSKCTSTHEKENGAFNSKQKEHGPNAESERVALGYHDKQLKIRNERSKEVLP